MVHVIKQAAIKVANILSKDDKAMSLVHEQLEYMRKSKRTTHVMYVILREKCTVKTMLTWPRVGTLSTDPKYGNNPDKWDDVDENGNKINGSFSNDIADNLPDGLKITQQLRNLSSETAMDKDEKETWVKEWTADRNNLRKMVRGSINLAHKMADTREMFPNVIVALRMEGDGDKRKPIMNTNAPLVISEVKPDDAPEDWHGQTKYLSIGEFMAFKLERAKANAEKLGAWKALVSSGGKGTKGGKGGKDDTKKVKAIETLDQFENYSAECAAYLDDGKGSDKGISQVINKLSKLPKGDERKHYVLSLYRIALAWDVIYKHVSGEGEIYAAEQSAINAGIKPAVPAAA